MAQVGGWIEKSGGIMLPAPKVQLYQPALPADVFVSAGRVSNGNIAQVLPVRYVKVTVPGLPEEVLNNLDVYAPQVELMRFTRLNSRENQSAGNGTKTSGYVHPAHGPGASGNGSFTHGGEHGGTGLGVQAIRPTEWPVLAGNSAIDVTQGILGFMALEQVNYLDSTGNYQLLDALCSAAAMQRAQARPGRRFPYNRKFSPGYFEFRLSVKDPSDPRGKRIHGPVSTRVACTNHKFPFNPAGLDPSGNAQASLAPGFDPKAVSFWLGSTSRIPAQ